MPRTPLWAGYVIGAALASQPAFGFELTFGGGSTALHSVAVGPNGAIVVAGTMTLERSAEAFDNDAYVAAFNRAGDKLWERYYGDEEDDAFHTLTVLADGGLLLGGAWGTGFLDSYCWVVRVDANGDVVWEQTFEAGDSCAVVALDPTAEGTIAIAGSSGLVARIGLDGEVLSSVQVEEVGLLFPSKFRTATLLAGDRVFVGGVTELRVEEESPLKPHIWVLALDPDGTLAAEDVTEPGATLVRAERSGEGVWFTAIAEGAFLVGSMSPTGQWLSFGRYGLDTTLPEWPGVNATFREPDGSLLVAGSGYTTARGPAELETLAAFAGGSLRHTQGWIARIDPSGRKAWEATFGAADRSDWINSLVALPGGGYAAVGASGGGGFASATSAWLFTIGSDHELE